MAQDASVTFDQQLKDQVEHAKARADASRLGTILNLSNAKMALGIVSQLLQRLHGLGIEDTSKLVAIEKSVAELQTILADRAKGEAQGDAASDMKGKSDDAP